MNELIRESVRLLANFGRLCGVMCGFVLPTLAAIYALYYETIEKISPWLFWLPMAFCFVVACMYAWYTFQMPIAAELYAETTDLKRENENLSSDVRYMSFLQEQVLAWNSILRGYAEGGIGSYADLKGAISIICDAIVEEREMLFNFERKELWNFAVYLWDTDTQRLCPIWREKDSKHPSRGMGREWCEGQGHVGHAFLGKDTLITPDATQASVHDLMAVGGVALPYDDATYVSYVSQPINRPGAEGRPHGVIVATSSRKGRFDKANALILLHASVVIASAIELAYNPQPRVEGRP